MLFRSEVLKLQHDTKNGRIFTPVKGHQDAELQYEIHTDSDPNVVEFTHTYVPPSHRNKGVGRKLAEEGVRFAMDQGFKIKPSCSFMASYIKERKDYQHLVVE
ncbi:MAG: GNAT family N-acetyltransferase [Bacteroidota bacterium]